ncbi:transposase [Pseudomonas soli]
MADSAGFEPATARFVAEYSIQLSYESVGSFRPDYHWLIEAALQAKPLQKWRTQEDSNLRPLGS